MSIRNNIGANFVGQFYTTAIGIAVVPQYIRLMGAESYGLVGFFALMQAWCQLLDFGLTPTMARETARFNGGAIDAATLRRLLRALETLFVVIGLLIFGCSILSSRWIATSWLKLEHLQVDEVARSIAIMGAVVALRWFGGLYRGIINGFERQVWLSAFNVATATARFVCIIPVLVLAGPSATTFFNYQLFVALAESVILIVKAYSLIPPGALRAEAEVPDAKPLKDVMQFALTVAFTTAISILASQTDKLILTKTLSLSDYAYFSLAVLVAGGVSIAAGPISIAVLPRLTRLVAEGNDERVIELYRGATTFVCAIAVPTALTLGVFSENVLLSWTGNALLAAKAAPILRLYALGNGIQTLGAFPYYLQFAKGQLRLNVIGNLIYVFVLIPAVALSTLKFGATGAGGAWISTNFLYLILWTPVVHRSFYPGLHSLWLWKDIFLVSLGPVLVSLGLLSVLKWPSDRLYSAILAGLIWTALVLITLAGSKQGRQLWSKIVRRSG